MRIQKTHSPHEQSLIHANANLVNVIQHLLSKHENLIKQIMRFQYTQTHTPRNFVMKMSTENAQGKNNFLEKLGDV